MKDISKIFSESNSFEWDKHNSEKIWNKHNVSTTECEQAFFNKPLVVGDTEKHLSSEKRFYSLGHTDLGRFLFIVFTIRKNKIRVISARNMSRKERKVYFSNEQKNS